MDRAIFHAKCCLKLALGHISQEACSSECECLIGKSQGLPALCTLLPSTLYGMGGGSQWLTLPSLLGSFPLQTSDAVVKVDVVSVGTLQGPLGKITIH